MMQSEFQQPVERLSVLITSVSVKVPMVRAVMAAVNRYNAAGQVFGADANADCVGRYFVDGFWESPRDTDLMVEDVISWCKHNRVGVIFPSRDGELVFWARHRGLLAEYGISVMVSAVEAVGTCLDKLAFHQHCVDAGFPAIDTNQVCDQIPGDRLVVKERFGAGAGNIGLDLDPASALQHAQCLDCPIFQPYIEGDEISADLYVSRSGRVMDVVLRRRDLVVNGESQVTTTFRDNSIEALCKAMSDTLALCGHVMFQILVDQYGEPHIVECNCRFGGASTLSIESGLDSFYWFLLESAGGSLEDVKTDIERLVLRQIRYAADKVVPL